jgi:hypothetical protein
MIDCVRTSLAAFILWRMNPASTKEDNEKFKKQVELDGDNEARSSKQGGGSRRALIGAVFDRLRFQNLHDENLLEAQVEKDNFHQFNSDFHKEKEMVDFRKWLLALAVVGLLLGIGSSTANAQTSTFTCSATTGVPNIIRSEGLTELLGDLVLNCTGGTFTPAGQPIPLQNVQISINTNITSRIVGPPSISEALLMIDEPFPSVAPVPSTSTPNPGQTVGQLGCLANNNTNCAIVSVGAGVGATGSYNGTAGHFNIFQGVQNGVNAIAWTGVPIDAPGTAGTRVIRITNIRANAFQLGVSSTLVPTQISMIIGVNGSQTISILQPGGGNVVGQVTPGLLQPPSVVYQGIPGPAAYQQCNDVNTYLLSPPGLTVTDAGINVSATEGFAYSFKPQSYAQIIAALAGPTATYLPPGTPSFQNVPGFTYKSESGFIPQNAALAGLTSTVSGEQIGVADHGTELQFTVSGVSSGVTLYAPSFVFLSGPYGGGTPVGIAVLINQSQSVGGAFTTSSTIPVAFSPVGGGPTTTPNGNPIPVASSGTTALLVYEIYYADTSVQETLNVPISVEFTSNTGSNIPTPTTTPSTVGVEFAPQSTVGTASSTAPIPRFGPSGSPVALFSISPCSCNLLFPFVTNIAGFDTGVAIANTSVDPYGTSPQTGTVTLNYYGTTSGGGAAPATATTTSAVPGGSELIFTLSNGGNFGIPATPGFEGYIIAQANFQYCHGFAFISDVGAQKLAEGYLAIQLDAPGLTRTHNFGENKGN